MVTETKKVMCVCVLGCDKDHDKVNAKGRLLKNLQRPKEAQGESD